MRRHIILGFLFVFVFSCILGSLPNTALADNQGTVIRDKYGNFSSVMFTVTSNAHSAGTVYRTTGLKIWIGPYYAFFDQDYLTTKGFYSSSTTDTVDFTASEIALRSGASVQQIRAAADDFNNGINLGAQIKILQNGVVKATIEEKEQVAPVFSQYGLGAYIAAAETRWGYAYDPVGASRTLTIQIEGQGSTTPAGSKAPGTVHKNMSDTVSLSAVPADGWKFAQWVDVTGGIVQFSTNPNSSVYMDKDKTIRAVFIPNSAAPPDDKKEYLTVVPYTYTLFEGEYKGFKAYHHKADGSSPEVTNSAEWSVSDSSIARLSSTTKGELWGVKQGFVVLKAQYKGMEATADVTVIPEPVPPPPNYAPKADFTISNPSPVEGEKVGLFDNSTHDGSRYGEKIVSWDWNIEKIGSSTDRNTAATWNEVGTYKVRLRVEDQDGDSDSCTKSVVVGPALPAAVITTSTDHLIIGREIHIDGDESTAAMDRDIKWDEMEWKFYNPSNTLAYEYTGRYPLGKGTSGEKDLTNSVLNKTGNWKITLKVKDTNDNESEITERIIHIYPDNPPIADFWLASEAIRYSYQGYDLTVRDLSTPGNPDASLGDEIYERSWTLYYDANNDGDAKGSGDEIIRPGDKGKAAEIIQVSDNDPRPLIRFNKTGRYQLELTVKERYTAWGEINEGLSANTDNKTLAEKQIMVINLAPTVAFDIKKKTPVDVHFAVDYSVSDTKYNSLESGQAGFINELVSGFIEPEVGVRRVNSGEIAESFSGYNPRNMTGNAWCALPVIRNFSTTTAPGVYNFKTSELYQYNGKYYDYDRYVDLNNGTVDSGAYPVLEETTFRVYPTATFSPDTPIEGYTFNERYRIVAKAGLLQVYQGNNIISTATDMPRSNVAATFPPAYGRSYEEADFPIAIVSFDTNKTLVLYQNVIFTNQTTFESTLITYCVDNNTGMIFGKKETKGLYPTGFRPMSSLNHNGTKNRLGFDPQICPVSGERIIIYADLNSPEHRKVHFVNQNNDLIYMGQGRSDDNSYTDVSLHPAGDNYVQYNIATKNGSSQHCIYNNQGTYVANLPAQVYSLEWGPQSDYRDRTPFHSAVGNNAFGYTAEGAIWYYENGSLKWKKPIDLQGINPWHIERTAVIGGGRGCVWRESFSVGAATLFKDYLVISDTYNGIGTQTLLLNKETGNIEYIIPLAYAWNDSNNLFLEKRADDGNGIVLYVFNQLQGLKYLKQAIENHNWDPDKCNVVVSVIDTDGFKDFETQKDSVVSLLQANNLKLAVISPPTGLTKSQAGQMIAINPEGGWWIQTADDMSIPASELAKKIIEAVNKDRGADNIVLVGQDTSLRANYQDPEGDPATMMTWSFTHDPARLGDYEPVEKADISTLHDTSKTVVPDENQTTLDLTFDQAGTYKVYCKAQDRPNTTEAYRDHEKAGNKWSNQDAYITIIAHYKPVASFTITDTTVNKNVPLSIIDNSYDPDLYNPISQATTDPLKQKGLRCWQWQYKKPDGTWESYTRYDDVAPAINTAAGTYQIRLRVQDVFEAWSDWTETKSFNVVNRPPVADFDALPNPVSINNSCSLIDYSYDPDGDPIINWEWTIQGVGELNKVNPNPFQVSWPNIGDYLVTLRVQDSEGAWSDPFSQTVKVINHMMLTLQSQAIGNGRGIAKASPGGNPPGPSGLNWVDHPVYPVTVNSTVIGAYSPNQQVTLTAETVTSESYFVEWREGDNVISTNSTCTINMTGDRTITAVFKKDPIFIPAVPPKIHVYIVK